MSVDILIQCIDSSFVASSFLARLLPTIQAAAEAGVGDFPEFDRGGHASAGMRELGDEGGRMNKPVLLHATSRLGPSSIRMSTKPLCQRESQRDSTWLQAPGTELPVRSLLDRACRVIPGRPQGRPAGRGSRGRERERVRGRFAGGRVAGRVPHTHTQVAHAGRFSLVAHATATAHAGRSALDRKAARPCGPGA